MPRVLLRHYNKLLGTIAVSEAMKRALVKAIHSVEGKTQINLHGIDDEMFVLSSRLHEFFGLVFLEANACGRVVVGGDWRRDRGSAGGGIWFYDYTPEDWRAATYFLLGITISLAKDLLIR